MTKASDERWEERLQTWAGYMLTGEYGARVVISSCYFLAARGRPAEGDGIPLQIGEALDTDDLVRRLIEHLRAAVWVWYVETGSVGEKAARLAVHRDTLADRVKVAKARLEDLHRARLFAKSKTRHGSPKML